MADPTLIAARTRLADAEMELDACQRWPLFRDLGWNRARITALKAEIAQLRQQVAILKSLTERADAPKATAANGKNRPVDEPLFATRDASFFAFPSTDQVVYYHAVAEDEVPACNTKSAILNMDTVRSAAELHEAQVCRRAACQKVYRAALSGRSRT